MKIENLEVVDVSHNPHAIDIAWTANIGFGHITFYKTENGEWEVDDEYMGMDFVRLVVNKWLESVVCDIYEIFMPEGENGKDEEKEEDEDV